MRRYRSGDEDSARWAAVSLRDGDVVVSTRSKHGTTWVQAILLMLVHGSDLPAPVTTLSPWVDHLVEPIDDVRSRLDAQPDPRVMKTHTPLDGLPGHDRLRFVVVARDPLDAAVSLYHQAGNIDRARLAELTSNATGARTPRPDLSTWMSAWVHAERDPVESLDSLQGVLWHLDDAWERRQREDVTLVHYADLLADLPGEVARLRDALELDPPCGLDEVVAAASFDAMRSDPDRFVPDTRGVLVDRGAFFRRGRSGAGRAVLGRADLATYHDRVATLVDPELAAWLDR